MTGVAIPDWKELGRRVRVAMAEDNLSYRQAAEVIGTSQVNLHRLALQSLAGGALMVCWLLGPALMMWSYQ